MLPCLFVQHAGETANTVLAALPLSVVSDINGTCWPMLLHHRTHTPLPTVPLSRARSRDRSCRVLQHTAAVCNVEQFPCSTQVSSQLLLFLLCNSVATLADPHTANTSSFADDYPLGSDIGPTVVVMRVGDQVFGGYASEEWDL